MRAATDAQPSRWALCCWQVLLFGRDEPEVTPPTASPLSPCPVETVAYAYDAGGQRIQKSLGGSAVRETPFTATYDAANRVTQITLNGEASSLAYDNNGNLAQKSAPGGTTTYTWTARNQLASIAGPSGSASFRYDAFGRRIEKTVNGVTTGFLYDGAQAIAELKGSALDTVYHTGLEIDEVLARYGAGGNKTLLTDALMSVSDGKQDRYYGPDGWPEADIDWGHDHKGQGRPHGHNWGRPPGGGKPSKEDRGDAFCPVPGIQPGVGPGF